MDLKGAVGDKVPTISISSISHFTAIQYFMDARSFCQQLEPLDACCSPSCKKLLCDRKKNALAIHILVFQGEVLRNIIVIAADTKVR